MMAGNVTAAGFVQELAQRLSSVNPFLASFMISFVSNSIPFMTVPYLALIAGYGALLNDNFERFLVGIGGGLGAAIGKMVVFYFGREFHRVLSEETRENLEFFAKAFQHGVFIAIFLFAALPLPDDVLYIPLGVAGYNPVLFFTAVALGKILLTLGAVYFGDIVGQAAAWLQVALGLGGGEEPNPVVTALLLLAASIAVTIMIIRMDWKRVVEVYNEYGPLAGLYEMGLQAVAALMPRRYGRSFVERGEALLERLRGEQQRRPVEG